MQHSHGASGGVPNGASSPSRRIHDYAQLRTPSGRLLSAGQMDDTAWDPNTQTYVTDRMQVVALLDCGHAVDNLTQAACCTICEQVVCSGCITHCAFCNKSVCLTCSRLYETELGYAVACDDCRSDLDDGIIKTLCKWVYNFVTN
jgi:hypothetical protein